MPAVTTEAGPTYCLACGYDLRGTASTTCPECGQAFDHDKLYTSAVPWERRDEIGRWRAFWRTCRGMTTNTRSFSQNSARPVSLDDALRFRRLVLLISYSSIVMMLLTYLVGLAWLEDLDWRGLVGEPGWFWVTAYLTWVPGLWCFLYALTGIHTYAFHPRSLPLERQNRAVALSYYACAPLAALPVLAMIMAMAFVASGFIDSSSFGWYDTAGLIVTIVWVGLGFGILAAWIRVTWVLARLAAERGVIFCAAMTALLPLAWIGLAFLTLLLPTVLLSWIALVMSTAS